MNRSLALTAAVALFALPSFATGQGILVRKAEPAAEHQEPKGDLAADVAAMRREIKELRKAVKEMVADMKQTKKGQGEKKEKKEKKEKGDKKQKSEKTKAVKIAGKGDGFFVIDEDGEREGVTVLGGKELRWTTTAPKTAVGQPIEVIVNGEKLELPQGARARLHQHGVDVAAPKVLTLKDGDHGVWSTPFGTGGHEVHFVEPETGKHKQGADAAPTKKSGCCDCCDCCGDKAGDKAGNKAFGVKVLKDLPMPTPFEIKGTKTVTLQLGDDDIQKVIRVLEAGEHEGHDAHHDHDGDDGAPKVRSRQLLQGFGAVERKGEDAPQVFHLRKVGEGDGEHAPKVIRVRRAPGADKEEIEIDVELKLEELMKKLEKLEEIREIEVHQKTDAKPGKDAPKKDAQKKPARKLIGV